MWLSAPFTGCLPFRLEAEGSAAMKLLLVAFWAFEVARPDVFPLEGWPVLLSRFLASWAKSRLFWTLMVDCARF